MTEPIITPEHKYFVDGVEYYATTDILKRAGLVDTSYFSEASALRGSYAHLTTELYDRDDLDEETLDGGLKQYLEAYKSFRRDSGFIPDIIEKRFAHNTYRYAGTIDRTGRLNGNDILLDIKTGASYPAVSLQVAAYQELLRVNGITCSKAFILYLSDTGKYRLEEVKDLRKHLSVFFAALTIIQWREQWKLQE